MVSEDLMGNVTTVVKLCVMTVAPFIGVSEVTSSALISVIVALVCLVFGYFDAKYPNTLIATGSTVDGDDGGA